MLTTMKKVIALSLILLAQLLIYPTFSAADSVPDEQFSLNQGVNTSDKVGVLFEESVDTLRMPTLLFGASSNDGQRSQVLAFCSSLEDPICAEAYYMRYYALLPPCKSLSEVDCIESIYAIVPGSPARIKGTYRESIPETVVRAYKADPDNGLPQGSNSGVWEIPNVKHGGNTTDYVAIVSRVGALKREGSKWVTTPTGLFSRDGDFRAAIYPTNLIKDSRYKANVAEIVQNPWGKGLAINHPGKLPFDICAIVADGVCAIRESFPENVQFGMVIRFSKVISGWMHGRIDSPEIDYELTSYGTRVDMKGFATRVPILGGWVSPNDFSAEAKKRYPAPGPLDNLGASSYPGSSGDYAMEMLGIWSKTLKDTAAANPSQWIFYNLPEMDIESASTCIKASKTLAGFVTTNSTTYTATPPIYNEQTGTLDYKVASPHFLPDGKVFQGKYNLYIDSKVARCIYKFSNAPISATVSITSADGGQQSVATTVVNEQNGWLHLNATGFTFSSPTLKVKLTQDANAVATPTTTPSPRPITPSATPTAKTVESVSVTPKKLAITCVKGKVTKKITAVAPKCPAGYKKKA